MSCNTDESVKSGVCYVDHIAVDSSFRGKGVGKILLDVADAEARKRGCRVFFITIALQFQKYNFVVLVI